ncbi:S1C family serine protease [[Clostridium] aminophilum]|uniref:Serine protease Do n=1 Tax=[Clostridium] aminophilum TaxID=1526 RepID=A0A1I6JTQ8_9FIRM|nr:trypsin-like peptidase domain-containing protein [[Clostridium] aminophilum]SFR82395.1 serine protease Do [[Clostridium] aminophilum]
MTDQRDEFEKDRDEYETDMDNLENMENTEHDAGAPDNAVSGGTAPEKSAGGGSWNSSEQGTQFGGFANSRYIGHPINDFESQTGWQDGPVPQPPVVQQTNTGKKVLGILVSGILFGVVAGGTMFGVNQAAKRVFSSGDTRETSAPLILEEAAPETEEKADSTVGGAIGSVESGTVTDLYDVSEIVENAIPSVVAINTQTTITQNDWFFGPQTYRASGSGSGIIAAENDSELLLISNNHVVADSQKLTVTFHDGTSVEAAVKGTDPNTDLAVIAVAMEDIPEETKGKIKVAVMGDSDSLKLGERVIAIGNALGQGQSVTSGVVSVLNKKIPMQNGTTRTLIQVDAAINPGNSGGALLNRKGELIGINSAKYSRTDVEGVGFAIPISQAKTIIDDLMTKKTKVPVPEDQRAYIGIQMSNIDAVTARNYNLPEGVYVYRIIPGFAAEQSDLKERDVIVKFGGETVRTGEDLQKLVSYYHGGETVKVTIMREDENRVYQEKEVEITLSYRKNAENAKKNGQP